MLYLRLLSLITACRIFNFDGIILQPLKIFSSPKILQRLYAVYWTEWKTMINNDNQVPEILVYHTQDMLLYTYFILTEIVHVTRDFNKDVNVNVLCIVEKAGDSLHTLDAYGCTSSWLSYLKSCVVRKLYLFLLANLLILKMHNASNMLTCELFFT